MTIVERRGQSSGSPPPGDRRPEGPGRRWNGAVTVAVLAIVTVLCLALGQVGVKAVYVVGGLAAVVLLQWSTRDLVAPGLRDARRRLRARPTGAPALSPFRTALGTGVAVIAVALLTFAIADSGSKALYAVIGIVVLAAAVLLFWPLIAMLFNTPPDLPPARPPMAAPPPGRATRRAAKAGNGSGWLRDRRLRGIRSGATRLNHLIASSLIVVSASLIAFLAGSAGSKALLVVIGALGVTACLIRARDKSLFVAFGTVFALSFLVHKSFGPIDVTDAGGAPSLYITSFDAMLVLLYAVWISEGTFVADIRRAFRRPIMWVPIAGAVLMLPSMLAGTASTIHGFSELLRMAWMYLLFIYMAVRVRSRAMIWAVFGGFGAFAMLEIVVVLLQWKTGGVLGLSFLGVPTHLSSRITDSSILGRPFGTIIHPDFMGAAMGSVGLLSFGLALSARRSLTRVFAYVLAVLCWLCLYLAHTRSALVGLVLAIVAMVVTALVQRRVRWSSVGRVLLVLALVGVVFFPSLEAKFKQDFGTGHFNEEVASRLQLHSVAIDMFDEHPVIGVGLNSFQQAMGPYEASGGVIFINNPVQNLYLLYLAETGLVGMAGVLLVGIAMYAMAIRLARCRDRLIGGIGLGVAGTMGFLMVEELLTFSLRQDVPLAIYWIFAGLAVGCYRLAGMEGVRRPRRRPLGDGGGTDARINGSSGEGPPRMQLVSNGSSERRAQRGPRPNGASTEAGRSWGAHLHQTINTIKTITLRVMRLVAATGRSRVYGLRRWTRRPRHQARRQPASRWSFAWRIGLSIAVIGPAVLAGLALAGNGAQAVSGAPSSVTPAYSTYAFSSPGGAPDPVGSLRVVFSARSSGTTGQPGYNGIFVANADGSGLTPLIVSSDQTLYNWPQWALNGTKIIFTARTGPPVSSKDPFGRFENIFEMNPDGSDKVQLTNYEFRAVQPKVTPAGTSVIFTAQNPQYPLDAVYRLTLLTLQATNLSQVSQPKGSIDADPKWAPTGGIVMTSTETGVPGTEIDRMNADGTSRQVLVDDGDFNTDPEVSPDGKQVAYSAFDGPTPLAPGATPTPLNPDDVKLNPQGWFVKVQNLATGATTVLNNGLACASPVMCQPNDSSGWKPVWSPDGSEVAWSGRLDEKTTCICAEQANGTDPRVLIQSDNMIIKWFDWTAPGGSAPRTAVPENLIGSKAPTSRLLISGTDLQSGLRSIRNEPPDMMGVDGAGTGSAPDPAQGSWGAGRSTFAFVADAPYTPDHPRYGPPPPAGHTVQQHFTLHELKPAIPTPFPPSGVSANEQVFLHRADGTIVQLTTPWTEDWRDALDTGDARANTDPVLSPNGHYVVFTNHSSLTGESFLLSMNLQTGAVLNLTNGTAGAMEVNDSQPSWSPTGNEIAFTTTEGAYTDVYVMNAATGLEMREITTDNSFAMDPAWSPDGKYIVFSRYDGVIEPTAQEIDSLSGLPTSGWSLVKADVATGKETVLTSPTSSPAWKPVYSPDGTEIDYIGLQNGITNLFQVTAEGLDPRPILDTPLYAITSVSWR